jgi:tRNA threonylcarbamoyladenosine biosynthesis protein TsaE
MIIYSEQEMLDFGKKFAKQVNTPTVIELIGDVGAGKTTFVRGLATGLDITEPITSPSFTISKSYALPNNKGRLVHYDFYRLSDPGLMSNDLADNLANPHNIIVIEWGESVENILPENRTQIKIKYNNDNSREVIL